MLNIDNNQVSIKGLLSDPHVYEVLELFGRDSDFGDKFIADQGIIIPSECSIRLWAFFLFASNKDIRENLVSNLYDMLKARGISIKLDLNSDESIDKIGKFLTIHYPLSAGRKISFKLPDDEVYKSAQEKFKNFKESHIPKEQHQYFSIIDSDSYPILCFESNAVVEWKEPVYHTKVPIMNLGESQGEPYVTEDCASAVMDVEDGKCVYFSHNKITDKTVDILRKKQSQEKIDDPTEYFSIRYLMQLPAYSLGFKSRNYIARKMQQGDVVGGHASLSALFQTRSDGQPNCTLYDVEFHVVEIIEKRSLNHIKASAESMMSNLYECAMVFPSTRQFDYKKGEMLYVRVVDAACNAVFDIEINVKELERIPVIMEQIPDKEGNKHTCAVRKKDDGKIKTENTYGDIMYGVDEKRGMCSSVSSQQPSTSLSNFKSNAYDNNSLMK